MVKLDLHQCWKQVLEQSSTAVVKAAANYTALAPSLFTTYFPQYTADEFSIIEIITAIGAVIAAAGALTGNAVAGAAGTLFAGATTEFANYLATIMGSDSTSTAADFSVYVDPFMISAGIHRT